MFSKAFYLILFKKIINKIIFSEGNRDVVVAKETE